jgi:threonine/homoserine/homoserine lactone efflux protein
MAFLPQFISTEQSMPVKIAVLVSKFLCIVFIILSRYSLFTGQMRHWLRHPKTMNVMN